MASASKTFLIIVERNVDDTWILEHLYVYMTETTRDAKFEQLMTRCQRLGIREPWGEYPAGGRGVGEETVDDMLYLPALYRFSKSAVSGDGVVNNTNQFGYVSDEGVPKVRELTAITLD